jgi:hypothetical protein
MNTPNQNNQQQQQKKEFPDVSATRQQDRQQQQNKRPGQPGGRDQENASFENQAGKKRSEGEGQQGR